MNILKWLAIGFLFMLGGDIADFLFDIFNHLIGVKIKKKILDIEKKYEKKKDKKGDKKIIRGFYRE